MNFRCPVCFYDRLPYPAQDYHICLCCGTEFGNDDVEYTYDELRAAWIFAGMPWFYGNPPLNWNPTVQLLSVPWAVDMKVGLSASSTEIRPSGVVEFELQVA
jgi:hypothetical protein